MNDVFDLSKLLDETERNSKQEFNEKFGKLLKKSRNFPDTKMYDRDLQKLFRYVLEREAALNVFQLNRIRKTDYVFYPKTVSDVVVYLTGHERLKKATGLSILVAYTPLLLDYLETENAKALSVAARAFNCLEFIEDVLLNFPTSQHGTISIKMMPEYTEQTIAFMKNYKDVGKANPLLALLSKEGVFASLISHGKRNYGLFVSDAKATFFFNSLDAGIYQVKHAKSNCKLFDFDVSRLREIQTQEQLEEYLIDELKFQLKFFQSTTDQSLFFLLSMISKSAYLVTLESVENYQEAVLEQEIRAVFTELAQLSGPIGEKVKFITGHDLRNADCFLGDLWKAYFRVHSNNQIEKLKQDYLIQVASGQKYASLDLRALVMCRFYQGAYINFLPDNYNIDRSPSILEALFSSTADQLVLEPENFIRVYELAFGENTANMAKHLQNEFCFPDFEFSRPNAKALIYAFSLINQGASRKVEVIRKLLRQVTPAVFLKVNNMIDVHQFFKTTQLHVDSEFNDCFINLNLIQTSQCVSNFDLIEFVKSNVFTSAKILLYFVEELINLPPVSLLNINVILRGALLDLEDPDLEIDFSQVFKKSKSFDDFWERAKEFPMMKTLFYDLMYTDFSNETFSLDYLLLLELPFYEKLAELQLKLIRTHPFILSSCHVAAMKKVWDFLGEKEIDFTYNWFLFGERKFGKETMDRLRNIEYGTIFFNLVLPEIIVDGMVMTDYGSLHRQATYLPLKKALETLSKSNETLSNHFEAIKRSTFDFTEFRHQAAKEDITRRALDILDANLPLFLEFCLPEHVAVLVITKTSVYLCNRAQPAPHNIQKYKLVKPVDKEFFDLFLNRNEEDNIFDTLEAYICGEEEKTIPRVISRQYAFNCGIQSWLMGLWCVFDALGIEHSHYRQLTAITRQSIWEELSRDINAHNVDNTRILVSIWLKSKAGAFTPKDFDPRLVGDEVLLSCRREFFYSSTHLANYNIDEDDAMAPRFAEKKSKYMNTPLVTNGDVFLEEISRNDLIVHPYLYILALCLRTQGIGVGHYWRTLDDEKRTQVAYYARTDQFNLIHAMLFSAMRFGTNVDLEAVADVWELGFGDDWREAPFQIFTKEWPISRIIPVEGRNVEGSAKGLFYLLFFCNVNASDESNLVRLFELSRDVYVQAFPDLKLADQIFAGEKISLDFPFHNLRYKYLKK